MWEKIKQHPWIVGGVVGLLLLVLVFSSGSSATGTATATDATSDGSGDQLTAYLASLNQQGQIASAAAGVQSQQVAGAVTVAQLQAGTADNANTLAAQVAEFETQIAGNVQTNHDTLSAQVAENTNNTNAAVQEANIAGNVQNTQTLANALVHSQDTQAAVSEAYITSLPGIIGAQSAGQVGVAQAQRPCSSYLFGLISSC